MLGHTGPIYSHTGFEMARHVRCNQLYMFVNRIAYLFIISMKQPKRKTCRFFSILIIRKNKSTVGNSCLTIQTVRCIVASGRNRFLRVYSKINELLLILGACAPTTTVSDCMTNHTTNGNNFFCANNIGMMKRKNKVRMISRIVGHPAWYNKRVTAQYAKERYIHIYRCVMLRPCGIVNFMCVLVYGGWRNAGHERIQTARARET